MLLDGMKRVRAALLKHGRHSIIARESATIVNEQRESMLRLEASTRDRFLRELHRRVAADPMSPTEQLAKISFKVRAPD